MFLSTVIWLKIITVTRQYGFCKNGKGALALSFHQRQAVSMILMESDADNDGLECNDSLREYDHTMQRTYFMP